MVYQEKVRGDGAYSAMPSRAMARNFSDLAHDVATLIELQSKLFAEDMRETGRGVTATSILIGLGVALGLGCFPVLLMGIALLLIEAGMIAAWAHIVTAVGGLLIAGIIAYAALRKLQSSMKRLDRSRFELVRNLKWIKETLIRTTSDRAGTHQPEAAAGHRT